MTKSQQPLGRAGGDFFHDLDLKITLSNRLLQPRILGLEASGALIVVRLKGTETRLLADPVPPATTDTGSPSASRMTATI
jgi:hypothetical protein